MKKETNNNIETHVFKRDLEGERPRTRAYVKQEADDSKEHLKRVLYSPTEVGSSSLEIGNSTDNSRSSSKFPCDLCKIAFSKREFYLRHELHFHTAKEAPIIDLKTRCCNICNKKFANLDLYRKHMSSQNNIFIPPSRLIPKPDPSKTPDVNDPNYYCKSCNYTFKGKRIYYKHLTKRHNMKTPASKRNRFRRKDTKAIVDILNLFCNVCTTTFSSKSNYLHHLSRLHKMTLPMSPSELSKSDVKRRYCKICERTYKDKYSLKDHLKKLHGLDLSHPSLIPNLNDENNHCIVCDIAFDVRGSYLGHLTSVHLNEMPELLEGKDCKVPSKVDLCRERYCNDCQKVFLLKRLYQRHLKKIHNVETTKRYPKAGDPDTNDPNNYCTACDKTFYNAHNFRRHLKLTHKLLTHSPKRDPIVNDEAPVMDLLNKRCNVCDRTYSNLSYYRIHMFKYHSIKVPGLRSWENAVNRNAVPIIDGKSNTCTACNKVYNNRGAYRSHLYSVHNIMLPHSRYKHLFNNRDSVPDVNDENNRCASCNIIYSSRTTYLYHLNEIHNIKTQEDTD